MRITSFTDYGIRTLMYLASLPPQELSSVEQVAKVYGLSQNHMVKVVGQLKKRGYVETLRGKNGGIRLAKDPDVINIGQVIENMENHLDGVDCVTSSCQLVPCCELKTALSIAMKAFLDAMGTYTLSDLMRNKQELIPLMAIYSNNPV